MAGQSAEVQAFQARIAELEALLAASKQAPATLTFKVSEKGGVSVYGMGRFPVTLYSTQWERLLGSSEQLLGFIKANQAKLSTKEARPSQTVETGTRVSVSAPASA